MSHSIKLLTAVAVAGALVPAVADARLGGQPTLTKVSSHVASLRFAADAKPTSIAFANGAKVGKLAKVGKHGSDDVYRVRVTFRDALKPGVKYTVKFKTPGEAQQTRLVKLRTSSY